MRSSSSESEKHLTDLDIQLIFIASLLPCARKKGLSEFLPTSVLEIAAYFNQIFLGASETTCQRWTKPASTIVPSSLQFSRSFVSVLGIVN
ncbi:cAMP-dependent protein kinase inhibitor beta isoform X1 [Bubalus kerabau]|uniref:cAMP-dependent protein kinase inhibitor beta isoform X1 n=1 Tax=Bubalus carabanensis TaxID=3119969 RepID=UPI00244EA0CB|nr:cAMP-dependent protein kinase inhibitor beta isoform X1 [Bubalus carabanensis]